MNQESQVLPLIPDYAHCHQLVDRRMQWSFSWQVFLTTLVFGRTGLTGLSCGFAGLSCDGFLFQNRSSPCQKIITLSENIWTEATSDKKDYMILTAGGLLKVQKGSSPIWAQTASGSFSILFTASVTSSSVS